MDIAVCRRMESGAEIYLLYVGPVKGQGALVGADGRVLLGCLCGLSVNLLDLSEEGAIEDRVPWVGLLREEVIVPEQGELTVVASYCVHELTRYLLRLLVV